MPDNRYFISEPLKKGNLITLEGDELHHLTHVMRKKEGSQLEIVNGQGELATATLTTLGKKNAQIQLAEVKYEPPPRPTIILAQAYPLPSKLEWIIEKGTELGASAFWLFPGQRSEKTSLSDNQRRRLHQLTIAALKQCGRLYLPPIIEKPALAKWTEKVEGKSFFGDPESKEVVTRLPPEGIFTIFIGPEGGFTEGELELFEKKFQAKGIRIHTNVLRAETAAICALSLLSQALTG